MGHRAAWCFLDTPYLVIKSLNGATAEVSFFPCIPA